MRNIKLVIEYDGTDYCGFQIQKNGKTIQAELEKALSRVCNKNVKITSSGRTDSGVHAKGHVANFKVNTDLDVDSILKGANSYLPKDIVILNAVDVHPDFHSRFSAKKKHYRYSIYNSESRSPLNSRYAYHYKYSLDIEKMCEAAAYLEGTHDFRSFAAKCRLKDNTVRTVYSIDVKKKGKVIYIDVLGNGFLYNMVRNIAGTLLNVGSGKFAPVEMNRILSAKNRSVAGPTAAAHGLCLQKVFY